jgi:hypothetical protein
LDLDLNLAFQVSTAYPTTGSNDYGYLTTGSGGSPTGGTTGEPSSNALKDLVNAMRAADAGKAQPGDIVLNWGNPVSGQSDVSPNP